MADFSPPERQVQLTVFDNEPLARMAEQRLNQEGIPCVVRSLGVGPGAWGSAYNLPHALYVFARDAPQARETLDLPPPELQERESQQFPSQRSASGSQIIRNVVLALIVVIVVLVAMAWFGPD